VVLRQRAVTLFSLVFLQVILLLGEASGATLVAGIRIEGLERVDRTSVERALDIREGEPFEESLVTRSIRNLYRLGTFSRVAITAEEGDSGIILTVRLREFPLIKRIEFDGNKVLGDQELEEKLGMKTFSFFDEGKTGNEVKALLSAYRASGYHEARIRTEFREEEDGVILTYHIEEGPKALVAEIDIIGNGALEDRTVLKTMQLKEKGPLAFLSGSGGYDEAAVKDDLARIQYLYMENGYLDVAVDEPEVRPHPDGTGVYVAIEVHEGRQYFLGEVTFSGDWEGPPAFARALPEVVKGDVFVRTKVIDDIRMFENSYRDQGYAWARIEPQFRMDQATGMVDLNMALERGPLVHVRWINISGNYKTRDYVIRREMRLMEGELFNQKKLDDSRKFINSLGFFESVSVGVQKVGEGQGDINVKIQEGRAGSLSAGMAYSSVSGLVGTLQLSLGNFFGRGQRLNLSLEAGSETANYSLSFTEPRLFSSAYSFGFDLFDRETEYSTYTQSSIGGGLRFGYRLSDEMSLSARIRRVDYEVYDINENASRYVKDQEGESTTSSVRFGFGYDTRDFPMDPREGLSFNVSTEVAGGMLGGTNDFIRLILEGSAYKPIVGDLIGSAHLEVGTINSFGGGNFSISERFFMGGLYTLRGFEYRGVGPLEDGEPVGGTKSFLVNLEATYPLIRDAKVKGLLFLDTGNVWADGEDVDFGDLRYGAGFGFRWVAPIGVLRLEWGFNLDPLPEEEQPGWEFSIGALF